MPITKKSYHFPLLLAITGMIFFSHLNSWSPPTIMEARNFISAREMLASGDWLIPTLNGKIRIRKPPLPTWLTAASTGLFGDPNSLAALRLPAAITAMLMVFFLYGLVKDIFQNSDIAFFSAIILGTAFMVIQESHTGSWDIYCNAFMLGGAWMLYRATVKVNPFKYFLLAGLLFGTSFLSKGPVSFYTILLSFLLALILSKHKFDRTKFWGMAACAALTIMISAAWPAYLHFKIPDIAMAIADEESSAWINRHNRPPWFYLHFPLFMGIWAFTALFSLIIWKRLLSVFERKKVLLILFWFIVTFVLLSVVPEKKERYFLPALIPLSIFTGILVYHQIKSITRQGLDRINLVFLKFQAVINILVLIAMPVFLWFFGHKYSDLSTAGFISASLVFILLAFISLLIFIKKRWIFIYPMNGLILLVFILISWPIIPNLKYKNPNYQDLRVVRGITEMKYKKFYTKEPLAPERLWEIGKHINVLETDKPFPANNAVIIASKSINIPHTRRYVFHYNPKNKEPLLYFYVKE